MHTSYISHCTLIGIINLLNLIEHTVSLAICELDAIVNMATLVHFNHHNTLLRGGGMVYLCLYDEF